MLCPKCGTDIPQEDAVFCYKCGHNLDAAVSKGEIPKTKRSPAPIIAFILGVFGLVAWLLPFIGIPVAAIGLYLGIKSVAGPKRAIAIVAIVLCSISMVAVIANASIGAYMGATGQHPLISPSFSQPPPAQEAAQPGYQFVKDGILYGADRSVIWGLGDPNQESVLELGFDCKPAPSKLVIGLDHPNGTRILAYFSGAAVHLYPKGRIGFDEFGELRDEYIVQAGTYDFDDDGNPEILIAVGNGLVEMSVTVYKYHAPLAVQDAGRPENWECIGDFEGQGECYIDEKSLIVPIGSQGLFIEYTFVKGKLVQTN